MRFAGIVSWATALAVTGGLAGAIGTATATLAEDCPGNPDAIGTSRTLMIDPAEYPRVGIFQYAALPLQDHEVVLTFDDGPIPPHTTRVLDALAAQCVKANFFLVGEMARNYPWVVRRIYREGHVIGTHSEDHPLRFGQLPIEKMRWEIDKGIADVAAALGDPHKMAPFFRIPGFARSDTLETELAERNLAVFSTDTEDDDWHRHISPKQIITVAISRLEKLGKGILLLHDIHPWTADALPEILKQLKEKGFHIVQVVPTPDSVAAWVDAASEMTVSLPMALQDGVAGSTAPNWPAVDTAATARIVPERIALPVPDAGVIETGYPVLPIAVSGKIKTASATESETARSLAPTWPDRAAAAPDDAEAQLPILAIADIGLPITQKLRPIETPAFVHSTIEARASRGGRHRMTRGGKREIARHEDDDAKTGAKAKTRTRVSRRDEAKDTAKDNYPKYDYSKEGSSREGAAKAARASGHGNAHHHARASSRTST